MPCIVPINKLRNTIEISDMCSNKHEPIFVTKNGYGNMVIMSMETYESELAKADIYNKILVAEKQIQNGELLDGEEVIDRLNEKYGY